MSYLVSRIFAGQALGRISNAIQRTLTSRGARFSVVPKAMKLRQVIRALRRNGCSEEKGTKHTKWVCPSPCGKHSANIPRHGEISPGVIGDTIERMECLPEGWLQ
jgi:hypothetical protein